VSWFAYHKQIFLKTYRSIRRFDQRAAFSTWLYRIAVNECRDHLRKQRARPLVYEADLSDEQVSRLDGIVSTASRHDGPSKSIEAKEALDRLLGCLTEQDRQLLILRELEGFSIQELANILDLNVNTLKVRLFRARGRVADTLRRGATQANAKAASRKETAGKPIRLPTMPKERPKPKENSLCHQQQNQPNLEIARAAVAQEVFAHRENI
jgi:RNA polymerase sigma factor (sigma-70 family)